MRVIGIDVGFKGAIALLGSKVDGVVMMPVAKGEKIYLDLPMIVGRLEMYQPDLVVIEKVSAMPKQGVTSVFRFGEQFGMIQGICSALNLPYILVRPQEWKKKILVGYPKGDKSASIRYVKQKYPHISLLPTKRSKKDSDGMADAICIAEYGLKYDNRG